MLVGHLLVVLLTQTNVEADATAGFTAVVRTPGAFSGEGAARLAASRTMGDVTAHATLNLFMQSDNFGNFVLRDLGSVVGAAWAIRDLPLTLRFDLFPLDGVRVREAFDYANLWGRPLSVTSSLVRAPLARVMLSHERFDVWGAVSGYRAASTNANGDVEVAWSGRFGAAARLPGGITLEARGGVHDRGKILALASTGIDRTIIAYGATGRLSWSHGGGVSPQVDLFTYRDDPERYERFFRPDPYYVWFAAWVGLEGGVLSQNLRVPGINTDTERTTTGYADLQLRLRFGNVRVFLTGRYQPTQFVLFDSPSITLYTNIVGPTRPRLGGWAGVDYRIDEANLEVGLQGRVIAPATAPCPTLGGNNPTGCVTALLVEGSTLTALASGPVPEPVVGGMVSLRFSPHRSVMLVTAADYERNPNVPMFEPNGTSRRTARDTVTVKLFLQARF